MARDLYSIVMEIYWEMRVFPIKLRYSTQTHTPLSASNYALTSVDSSNLYMSALQPEPYPGLGDHMRQASSQARSPRRRMALVGMVIVRQLELQAFHAAMPSLAEPLEASRDAVRTCDIIQRTTNTGRHTSLVSRPVKHTLVWEI